MFTEIAPGVFSVDHRVVEGKNGIVFGTERALAIDCGNYPEEGDAMAAFLRERGFEPDRLVLTHGHGDHVLGGGAFLGAEVFAHSQTPAVIGRHLPSWAERAGATVDDLRARLPMPTVTFADELQIDLGGTTVRLLHTPGHSADSSVVYLVEHRVLFAADTVVTGIVPAIGDGDGRDLEASLRRLTAMEIDVLVPGHGPTRVGSSAIREHLLWLALYLADVRRFVLQGLVHGDAPEAIVDAATYERFVGDRLPREKYGMERRHRETVAKIVAEEG